MKTRWFILFFVVFSQLSIGQEDKCASKEKQLSQFISDRDYKKAYDVWNEVKTLCPKESEKIYKLGNEVLQYNVEASNSDKKEEKVRELIKFYGLYDKNFPDNENGNFEKRAMALYDNKVGTNEEVFGYLNQAFEKQKNTFSNPQALSVYFQLYFEKNKSDKSVATAEKLIDKYVAISSLCASNSQKFPEKTDEYSRVMLGLDSYMNDVLVCNNLNSYATNAFKTNKADISWLETTGKIFSVRCNNAAVFGDIAQELHTLKPSSKSAYHLATYNLYTGKQDKAIDYFSESITLAKDKEEKAATAYTAASILANTDKVKAREMINIAIQNNTSNGKYYIFLANLYVNSLDECASDENERKAIYKLASDTVLLAGQAEPRLKPASDGLSKGYLKNVVFDKKDKTKSVQLGCWINQTVKF